MSQHTYRPLDKMDFTENINVDFQTDDTAEYVPYYMVENRIKDFEDVSIIGVDSTNTYNIYKIELGTKGKPIIVLMSGVHGTEYAGAFYNLGIMEDLRDDTFPVEGFRNEILENFHIICFPVMNPYGWEYTTPYAITRGRYLANGYDLNRQFSPFKALEAIEVKKHLDDPNIFAFADNHLIRNYARKPFVVFVGNGQHATNDIRDHIVESMNDVSNNLDKPTQPWEAFVNMTRGITRRYMRDKVNKHTEFTLSYTIELARPVNESEANGGIQRPFDTDYEQYDYGYKVTYMFLRTSMDYYYAYKGTGLFKDYEYVNDIKTPDTNIEIVRNDDNIPLKSIEESEKRTIETDIYRVNEDVAYIERVVK